MLSAGFISCKNMKYLKIEHTPEENILQLNGQGKLSLP